MCFKSLEYCAVTSNLILQDYLSSSAVTLLSFTEKSLNEGITLQKSGFYTTDERLELWGPLV